MDPLGMFLESLCHWFHWFVTTTITGMDDLGAWMGLPETNRQHFAPKNRALKAPPKGTESSHPPSNFQGQTGWIPFGDMPQNLKHKAHWDCRKVDLQLSWGIPALWWNTALFLLGEWLMGFLHHLFEKKKVLIKNTDLSQQLGKGENFPKNAWNHHLDLHAGYTSSGGANFRSLILRCLTGICASIWRNLKSNCAFCLFVHLFEGIAGWF